MSCERRYSFLPRAYPDSYWQLSSTARPLQYTQEPLYHYDYAVHHAPQHHQQSEWLLDSAQQPYRLAVDLTAAPAVGFADSYPESSQRTILTPQYSLSPKNNLPNSPSLSPDDSSTDSWNNVLDDSSESSRHPSVPLAPSAPIQLSAPLVPSSPPSPVKEEPDDNIGRFIMELSAPQVQSTFLSQSLAPPTEVPLRATQAPPEMRSMMGVFRLNPFAMHSGEGRGVVAPTWCGEEAHPLDDEPIIFEFQLELEDTIAQVPEQPKEPLRSFSPDFELHEERDDGDQSDWRDSESAYASTPPTWELDYPSEEQFPSSESVSTHLQAPHSSRLYECMSF